MKTKAFKLCATRLPEAPPSTFALLCYAVNMLTSRWTHGDSQVKGFSMRVLARSAWFDV